MREHTAGSFGHTKGQSTCGQLPGTDSVFFSPVMLDIPLLDAVPNMLIRGELKLQTSHPQLRKRAVW